MVKTAINDILFLLDFRESRCLMTPSEYKKVYGDYGDIHEDAVVILQYGYECGYRIDMLKNGEYYLILARSESQGTDLTALEEKLWYELVRGELGR